jgi:hypothetical protein
MNSEIHDSGVRVIKPTTNIPRAMDKVEPKYTLESLRGKKFKAVSLINYGFVQLVEDSVTKEKVPTNINVSFKKDALVNMLPEDLLELANKELVVEA